MADIGWRIENGRHYVTTSLDVVVPPAESCMESLSDLYRKASRAQWDAELDLDWDHGLNEENPLSMPDPTIAIAGTPVWARMSAAEKARLRQHLQAWHVSQILHGERASLLCAGKILISAEDPAVKSCAAAQAIDEVRHIEVYERLLAKIGPGYAVSPSLDRVLFDTLADSSADITALGMQILIEGLALAFFKSLQLYSTDPLVRKLQALVVRDEARHFAVGQLFLAERHQHLTAPELARREEFIIHAFKLLDDYLFADEIWEPAGLSRAECAGLSRTSPVSASMHRVLFRQLVPAVRAIGLLGEEAKKAFADLGVLDYAALPV